MKELIERVKAFRRKPIEEEIEAFMDHLGPDPSLPLLEEALKRYKAAERQILTKDLIEWMNEHDLNHFETEDLRVSIATYVAAKISEEDAEKAFAWLEAHQYGELIKDTVNFPKGEFSVEAQALLDEMGLSYTVKHGIHPQSLKKILRDRLLAGEDMPTVEDGFEKVEYYDECIVKEKT